jgi:hypothetical protein
MLALKMGATLIQGYYFSEPGKARGSLMAACREKIESVVHKYKHHLASSLHIKQSCYGEYARLLYGIGLELASISPLDFEDKLTGISQRHPHLECLFMLDQEGKQVGHRVSNRYHMPHGKMIFSAMKPGADHSMYEYYYCLLENHLKEFTFFSKPYLSQSTGKLCITVSTLFKNADGDRYILCGEVKPEHLLMQS